MPQQIHNTAKLPQKLLDELGLSGNSNADRGKRIWPGIRKERRKTERGQRKGARASPKHSFVLKAPSSDSKFSPKTSEQILNSKPEKEAQSRPLRTQQRQKTTVSEHLKSPKSILRATRPTSHLTLKSSAQDLKSPSPSSKPKVSKGTQDRLAADNAEIAALEKALGIKDDKKLPRSFADDGLDTLLDGIGNDQEEASLGKRKRDDGDDWLERKRQKARGQIRESQTATGRNHTQAIISGSEDEGLSEGDWDGESSLLDVDEDEAYSLEAVERGISPLPASMSKTRENPYVAPVVSSGVPAPRKYIPPSLRNLDRLQLQEISQTRRQIQGLLNRLSEANLISILRDVEKLYRDHPRQHVSSTLLDLLMGLLCDPASLQDTFIILHAGFIAAIYKVVGMDFGAQVVQRIDEEIVQHFQLEMTGDGKNKVLINLISLLSELYNFQVVGSNIIYDFISLFLEDLTETNVELLLKILRNSGPQLRQDDPSSLRKIILLVQPAIARIGEQNLSVRTQFMIETIYKLKNNRMKTDVTASTIASAHTVGMKKILGSLNTRNVRATEPLRIGRKDIQDSDKRGKWWLVGASYTDKTQNSPLEISEKIFHAEGSEEALTLDVTSADLIKLAKDHRMNTDVRRSVFVAIMSATDYNDAHLRLQKLRLKKKQEIEIPKVLIHCSAAESSYNPFYTLVSRRVCSDRKLKMAFQLSLWTLFKRMGEEDDEDQEDQDSNDEDSLELRSLVNLAKMFGVLIAEGGLGLGVLKTLNFAYLHTQTRTFVEVLMITVILHSQRDSKGRRAEQPLMEIFLSPKEAPAMAQGLQYFLKKIVSKTDIAGSSHDKEAVKWGCKVAGDALTAIASSTILVE